ncbi:MAG TPA: hypothetical protein VGC29_06445, partial [Flavisolibacter sp.]
MRKLVLSLLLAASFTGVFAQKLDDIKEKIQKGKYDEAKEKLDKVLADPKNQNNADAWFYKAKIHYNMSKANAAELPVAAEAMKKYLELEQSKDEKTRMLLSTFEGHQTAFDIYTDQFKSGVNNFQSQKYAEALTSFKGALDAFDLLTKYNLTTVQFDTTATIYAGFAAQNAKEYDEAAKYYEKMVNQKIYDTNYLDAYRFLIFHNLENKKDTAAALKFLEISESAFPLHEEFWIDYEMAAMSHDRAQKLDRYKYLSTKYPNNYVVALNYGVELYNHTFFSDPKPDNYIESQEATRKQLERALELNPDSHHGTYIMSQFYVNKIYDVEDSIRNVKGTTAADVAKKKALNARMEAHYEEMHKHSLNAYAALLK